MKKGILSFVSAAAIAGAFSFVGSASADEVTVQKGDTLWDIANKHQISVEELKEWNDLSSNIIRPEERLKVALTENYHIQKGDTLSEIAENYSGISWQTLQKWNSINNADLIYAGDTLKVYLKGGPVGTATQQEKVETPKAKKDETVVSEPKQEVKVEEESKVESTPTEQPVHANEQKRTETNADQSEEKVEDAAKVETDDSNDKEVIKELTMVATAYTASCEGCSGITSTGINLLENPDMKVISVDPSVIPLGSKVYVEGYGEAIAGDTGGAIVGNKIDIFIPNKQDAINWGVKEVNVKVYK